AKDRTVCSAYSVRPRPDARVSAPVTWEELWECRPEDFTLRTMPARFAAIGDRHADIDAHPCSLEALLELSKRQEAEGMGDAPWPPHYQKQEGEPPRVQPSKRKGAATGTGRRVSTKPLLEIGRAVKKADALAGLERWRARHPEAATHLLAADVLVDSLRGRFTTWTRVRVNPEHVPEALRPPQEPLDPDAEPEEIRAWHAHAAARKAGRPAKDAPPDGDPESDAPSDASPSRRSRPARREEGPRAGRSGSPAAACRAATAGRRRRAGSGCPAGGRTSPRTPAPAAAAPPRGPCPGSSGSGRRACGRRRPWPPPPRARDARRARSRGAAQARSRAAAAWAS